MSVTSKRETVFLPDGTPTDAQAGDEMVWHKQSGKLTLRRPGIGELRTDPPMLPDKNLVSDGATVEEARKALALGFSLGFTPFDLETASNDGYEVVFRIVGPSPDDHVAEIDTPFRLADGKPTRLRSGDEIYWHPVARVLEIFRKDENGTRETLRVRHASGEITTLSSFAEQTADLPVTQEMMIAMIKFALRLLDTPLGVVPQPTHDEEVFRFLLE